MSYATLWALALFLWPIVLMGMLLGIEQLRRRRKHRFVVGGKK